MAYKDFIKFSMHHRNLLEMAIKKYPTILKKSDLVEFDQVISESKKELRNQGILEEWKPYISFKRPEDYLYSNAEEIFLESYLGSNYHSILTEKLNLDDKAIAGIKGGLKTQINALKNIRKWHDALPEDKKKKLDAESTNLTKSHASFSDELNDIEEEIDGVFGTLDKEEFGFFNRGAKRIFGGFQRGLSRLFGGGGITDDTVQEQMLRDLFQEEYLEEGYLLETEDFGLPPGAANQIGTAFYNAAKNRLGAGATQAAIAKLMGSQQSAGLFQQAAKSILGNDTTIPMGNVQAAVHASNPLWNAPRMPGLDLSRHVADVWRDGPPPHMDPTATINPIKTAKDVATGAVPTAVTATGGIGTGGAIAIGAGIAALIATGAAGIKLRNRRKRIEVLQMLARKFGAPKETVEAMASLPNEAELEKVKPSDDPTAKPSTDSVPANPTLVRNGTDGTDGADGAGGTGGAGGAGGKKGLH